MSQARHKPTTNEFYRSILDNALREEWKETAPDEHQEKVASAQRLSNLYGYSKNSQLVRERARHLKHSGSSPHTLFHTKSSRKPSAAAQTGFQNRKPLYRSVSALSDVSRGMLDSVVENLDSIGQSGFQVEDERASELSSDDGHGLFDELHSEIRSPSQQASKSKQRKHLKQNRRLLNAANSMLHPGARAPPWYTGYQNSAAAPAFANREISQRFGYGSMLNFQRSQNGITNKSVDLGITNVTLKNSLPKYRGDDAIIDEYKPPLSGQPGAWPLEGAYVSGSNLRPKEVLPELTKHLKEYNVRIREGVEEMNTSIMLEQHQADLHRSTFAAARPKIEIHPLTGKPVELANQLISEIPRMRYLQGATVLTEKVEDETALEKLIAKQQQQLHAMISLKWSESLYLYKLLRALSVQLRPGLDEFFTLMNDIRNAVANTEEHRDSLLMMTESKVNAAFDHTEGLLESVAITDSSLLNLERSFEAETESKSQPGDESAHILPGSKMIDRETFANVVCAHFEHADRRRINKLYSGFDPHRIDEVDYRIIMATQRCFWKYNSESMSDKLISLFDIMDSHDQNGVISADDLLSILRTCAATENEELDIIDASRTALGHAVIDHTLLSEPGFLHRDEFIQALSYLPSAMPLLTMFEKQLQSRLEILLNTQQQQQQQQQQLQQQSLPSRGSVASSNEHK